MALSKSFVENLSVQKIEKLLKMKKVIKDGGNLELLKKELNRKKADKKSKRRTKVRMSAEKIIEQENSLRREKRKNRKEVKLEIETSKISRQVRDALEHTINEFASNLEKAFEKRFEENLKRLNTDGIFYKCEYLELEVSEIAKRGIKNLGKEGWIYSFDLNDKMIFRRIKGGK